MNIVKCDCSRSIHIHAVDGGKCPFCNIAINANVVGNLFGEHLSFLNEKLADIDDCINAKNFINALCLIDDVLEWLPGWGIGDDIPRTGEVYWRKLLAETECRSDVELLRKGKILEKYPSFNNAIDYANENEKPVYTLIKKIEDMVVQLLENALDEHECEIKRKTGVEKLLVEYKKRINDMIKSAQDNIAHLERIERAIQEQIQDCTVVAGEFKYALEIYCLSEAKKIGGNKKSELARNEADFLQSQLDDILSKSNNEFAEIKKLESSHPKFLEYSRLIKEQSLAWDKINQNKSELGKLNSEAEQLVSLINKKTDDYEKARTGIQEGSYARAVALLTQARFDEILKQAVSGVKAR